MARLSAEEKQEFLEDSLSLARRRDFETLRSRAVNTKLTPSQLVAFLDWAQSLTAGKGEERKPMPGSIFLL